MAVVHLDSDRRRRCEELEVGPRMNGEVLGRSSCETSNGPLRPTKSRPIMSETRGDHDYRSAIGGIPAEGR